MTKLQIWNAVDDLRDTNENFSCETCPFAEACKARQLWWGCGEWEDQQGEDL